MTGGGFGGLGGLGGDGNEDETFLPIGDAASGLRIYDHTLGLYGMGDVEGALSSFLYRTISHDSINTPGGAFGITIENSTALPITFDIKEVGVYDVADKTVKAPPEFGLQRINRYNTANLNRVVDYTVKAIAP